MKDNGSAQDYRHQRLNRGQTRVKRETQMEQLKQYLGNVLGYYRNLGSLRYRNEYCVERCCMRKCFLFRKQFFLFNWSLIQSRSYDCTLIGSSRIKKWTDPRRWRASQWLFSQWLFSPPKWEGHLAMQSAALANATHISFEGSNRGMQFIPRPGMQYLFPYLREPRLR